MTRVRRWGAILLAGGLLGSGLVSTAAAHDYSGSTAGVWSQTDSGFEGRIGANVEVCVPKRLVKVQRLDGNTWETVAKTTTDKGGYWAVDAAEDEDETHRHVVRPTSDVTNEHSHECNRFASPML